MKKWFQDWTPLPADMIAQTVLVLFALLGGMLASLAFQLRRHNPLPVFIVAGLAGIVGVVLLFFARLPLYRQRQFFTFGCRNLDPAHRRLYRLAYCFLVVSCVLLVAMLFAGG